MHDPAVHLPLDEQRIDRRAAVVDRHVAHDLDLAGLRVHSTTRMRAEGNTKFAGSKKEFSSSPGSKPAGSVGGTWAVPETSAIVIDLSGGPLHLELAVGELDVVRRGLQQRGAIRLAFSRTFSAALATASPPTESEREPYVPLPHGPWSVSPWITSTFSGSTPRLSATIWAKPCRALAVRRGTGEHRRRPRRVHAHHRGLPEGRLEAHAAARPPRRRSPQTST